MIAPVTLLALRGVTHGYRNGSAVLGAVAFVEQALGTITDLWFGRLYRTGRCNESTARGRAYRGLDARVRGMGRASVGAPLLQRSLESKSRATGEYHWTGACGR